MKFKTWKIIKLGTGLKTGDDFRAAIKDSGCVISGFRAQAMLDGPDLGVSFAAIEVQLVNVSVDEMGFYEKREGWNDITSASLKDIYQRAQGYGLGLCPAEVGPQLRLQHLDQPQNDDDNVNIGMNPIPAPSAIKDNQSAIFRLACSEGKLVLTERPGMFYQQFYLKHRFIFFQKQI